MDGRKVRDPTRLRDATGAGQSDARLRTPRSLSLLGSPVEVGSDVASVGRVVFFLWAAQSQDGRQTVHSPETLLLALG